MLLENSQKKSFKFNIISQIPEKYLREKLSAYPKSECCCLAAVVSFHTHQKKSEAIKKYDEKKKFILFLRISLLLS